jgi:hypothetical protein
MTRWIEVLVAMAEGPSEPVHGTVRTVDADSKPERVNFAYAGEPPMFVGLGADDVRVWRDGSRTRIETTAGEPLFITDGTTAWRFEPDEELPLRADARRVHYLGAGRELAITRPASDWIGDDFTRPSGPVVDTEFLGRSCWEVELAPPPRKPDPIQIVVDKASGAVLQQRNDAAGWSVSYIDLDLGTPSGPELFNWNGPVRTNAEAQRAMRARQDADRESRLRWFADHVTASPLGITVAVPIDVSWVHTHSDDGSFTANLGNGSISGMLARRPRIDTAWDLNWSGQVRMWSTTDFDWAVMLYDLAIDDDSLVQLQAALHPREPVRR